MTATALTTADLTRELPPARSTRSYLADADAAAIVDHLRERLPALSHAAIFDLLSEWKRLQHLLHLTRPYLQTAQTLDTDDHELRALRSWVDSALTDLDRFAGRDSR